ncbi:MAG: diguanylate cyclase [Limnobacter sp.]|nr:diguanylate cyclase [Limnobacter sp.]
MISLVLTVIGGSIWVSKALNKPIQKLTYGARQITEGEYHLRLLETASPELAPLVHALNEMAEAIEVRDNLIRQTAYKDKLTGLDNRVFLTVCLENRIAASREPLAVLMWSVENMDHIYDVMGHEVMEAAIQHVAKRARRLVPKHLALARIESNTFCLVAPGDQFNNFMELNLKRIFSFTINKLGYDLEIDCKGGLVFYPANAQNAESLLQKANCARLLARKVGAHCLRFQSRMEQHSARRLDLLNQIRDGLVNQEFQLYLQPKLAHENQPRNPGRRLDTLETPRTRADCAQWLYSTGRANRTYQRHFALGGV